LATSTKFGDRDKKSSPARTLTPEQSRAARGWLGWSQTELGNRAKVSLSTVRDFETRQRTPIANNIEAMQRALEAAGIRLLFDPQNGAAIGVGLSEYYGRIERE
jgi:ribosome-binding protein aMBF1 (putative translation factor)